MPSGGAAAPIRGHPCKSGQKSAAAAGKTPGRILARGGRMARNARVSFPGRSNAQTRPFKRPFTRPKRGRGRRAGQCHPPVHKWPEIRRGGRQNPRSHSGPRRQNGTQRTSVLPGTLQRANPAFQAAVHPTEAGTRPSCRAMPPTRAQVARNPPRRPAKPQVGFRPAAAEWHATHECPVEWCEARLMRRTGRRRVAADEQRSASERRAVHGPQSRAVVCEQEAGPSARWRD